MSDLFSVSGKVVVVTGGGRGIGLMIAKGFVEGGAKVYISSRTADVCHKVAKQLTALGPGSCIAYPEDLSIEEGCKRFVEKVAEKEKKVHVLVNNSGTSWGANLDEFPADAWDKVINLNLKSPFFLTRGFLPLLRAAALPTDPARVIMIGSIVGVVPQQPPTYSYDASKAALHNLTRKLASEFASSFVTVNAIAPGYVPSKMGNQLQAYGVTKDDISKTIPLKRMGDQHDMAGAAIFLSSKAGSWITGVILPVDGGMIAQPPQFRASL